MGKIKQVLTTVLTLTILLTGCKKDEISSEEINGDFNLEAKVDNQLFTINKCILMAVIANNAGNAGSYLNIAAYSCHPDGVPAAGLKSTGNSSTVFAITRKAWIPYKFSKSSF